MRVVAGLILSASFILGGPAAFAQPVGQASAELRDPKGRVVGSATFSEEPGGVRVRAQVRNLPSGSHGIHIHGVGRCDPPDFTSAAEHLNLTSRQHGLRLEIAANGSGQLSVLNSTISVGGGPNSLFDTDGSALVIHANAADDVTDPAGNSEGRLACGVIARGGPAAPAPVQDPGLGNSPLPALTAS
jgi:Cu-Zn family superoxide dismutase